MQKRNEELEAWKDAVWDFLLEHCDITEGGSLFIKFHCDHRKNFENRIIGRYRYGYHRGDPREKEKVHLETKTEFIDRKKKKKERWMANREERRKALAEVKRINALSRMPKWKRIFVKYGIIKVD